MPTRLDELLIENVALVRFAEAGHSIARGIDLCVAFGDCPTILWDRVKNAARILNRQLPDDSIDSVSLNLARPPHPTLIENNRWFHGLLTDGVPIEYKDSETGEMRGGQARVIDFDNPANNDFLVVRQLTIQGPSGKTIRPDLILHVNGLPLVMIELKDSANAARI